MIQYLRVRKAFVFLSLVFLSSILLFSGTIRVTYPDGGESWRCGERYQVMWTSSGCGDRVKISLISGGDTYTIIDRTLNEEGTNRFDWTIPDTIPSGSNYRVKVEIIRGGYCVDQSDGYFTIEGEVSSTIKVTSPNGGENWRLGEKKNITWTSSGTSESIWISLYIGTRNFGRIAENIPISSGSYKWEVGKIRGMTQTAPTGSNYTIEIFTGVSRIKDKSDAPFTISRGFKKPEIKRKHPGEISGLPDFVIQNVRYNYWDKTLNFDVGNKGIQYVGNLDISITCDTAGNANRHYTTTFTPQEPLPSNGSLPRGVTLPFDWPTESCYMNFIIVLDSEHKIRELNKPNIWQGEVYPTSNIHFRFWPRPKRIRFKSGGNWHQQGDGFSYFFNSPDEVIVTQNNTILMDISFTIKNCSSKTHSLYARLHYYGSDNFDRYHDIGNMQLGPGEEKLIQKRIQLKIRREGNFVRVQYCYSGSVSWESCRVEFKFGRDFF